MAKKISQKHRIVEYLHKEGSITALDAVRDLGILQLSARLVELERCGYIFHKENETAKNRYGENVHFTRYSIISEGSL